MDKVLLDQILSSGIWDYNDERALIRIPTPSALCHSVLTENYVHTTVTSLQYALALLDQGDRLRSINALRTIEVILSMQDQRCDSDTLGLWTWFAEEQIESMVAPDYNLACFMAIVLIDIIADHENVLPHEIYDGCRQALKLAAQAAKRRNCPLTYSNISCCECYVAIAAGETLGDPELSEFGRRKLQAFCEFTETFRSFSEYNSPHYYLISLRCMARLSMINDSRIRDLSRRIEWVAWKTAADYFHPKTGQWSGPHSRSYSNFIEDSVRTYIQRSIGEQPVGCLDDLEAYRDLANRCPENLRHIFREKRIPQTIKQCFQTPVAPNFAVHEPERECGSRVGTTYMTESFVLSSMNMEDCWEQRRHVFAYFGEEERPTYLRLRVLHDNRDFCSALCCATQNDNTVLGTITLVTDNGDSHTHLDPIRNFKISAVNLCVRLEIGGALDGVDWVQDDQGLHLTTPELSIQFRYHPQNGCTWETCDNQSHDTISYDLIYHRGTETSIYLPDLEKSSIGFSLSINDRHIEPPQHDISCSTQSGKFNMTWNSQDLSVSCPDETSTWKDVSARA